MLGSLTMRRTKMTVATSRRSRRVAGDVLRRREPAPTLRGWIGPAGGCRGLRPPTWGHCGRGPSSRCTCSERCSRRWIRHLHRHRVHVRSRRVHGGGTHLPHPPRDATAVARIGLTAAHLTTADSSGDRHGRCCRFGRRTASGTHDWRCSRPRCTGPKNLAAPRAVPPSVSCAIVQRQVRSVDSLLLRPLELRRAA